MFILILTIVIGSHVTTSTAEFGDAKACRVAADYVRADLDKSYETSSAARVIATCAPKSLPPGASLGLVNATSGFAR
jgi:hypothetical protein